MTAHGQPAVLNATCPVARREEGVEFWFNELTHVFGSQKRLLTPFPATLQRRPVLLIAFHTERMANCRKRNAWTQRHKHPNAAPDAIPQLFHNLAEPLRDPEMIP
jgi:hypothetical protein